ncbi:RANBP2 [Branchiostoma lanceolatum]|uniref:RANBP2 protein n=1 Tax=Branchiostoma lanceolatum TaxID=7740 RepID=A0A8K0ESL7_BRALA|nr:RANBP2 [Branchiostoma lanceolatum]
MYHGPIALWFVMASEVQQNIVCSICLELFHCPVVLPCCHSFCKKCISDWVDMSFHRQRAESFTCPECRMPFNLNRGGVEALPFNHALSSMVGAYRTSGNGGNFLSANGNARLVQGMGTQGVQVPGRCREHGKSLLMYCMACEEECCLQCIKEPGGKHPASSPQHNVKNKYVATSLRKSNTGKAINEIKSQMEAIKKALDMKTAQMMAAVQSERAEKQERLDAIRRGLNTIRDDSRFLLGEGGNSEKFLKEAHAVQVRAAAICANQDWNDHSLGRVQKIPSERQLQTVKCAIDNIFCQKPTNKLQVHGDGWSSFEQARSEFTPSSAHAHDAGTNQQPSQGFGGRRNSNTQENKASSVAHGRPYRILTKQPESTVSSTEKTHLAPDLQLFPKLSVSCTSPLPTIAEEIPIADDGTPKMTESMPNEPTNVHANPGNANLRRGHEDIRANTFSKLTKENQKEEEIMFQQTAKLFLWESDRTDWKELGAGDLKILRHNVTGKARVLMWSDGTYSVQANHYITADMNLVHDKIGGENALVWSGIDAADGSRKEAFFAAAFCEPDAATVYKKVFKRCVARETAKERTASASSTP